MKKTSTLLLLLAGYLAHSQQPVTYVNPLMGTSPATTISAAKHGAGTEMLANVIPAVGIPFGMVQLTPQTRTTERKCLAPYYYQDGTSSGYRLSHWLSGSCTQDYGSVTIMPLTGTLRPGATLPLDHHNEASGPHYYKNRLGKVQTELTATARCGMLQFTMLEADSLFLLVTPNSDKNKGFIRIDTARKEISGYNPAYRIYQGSGQPAGFSGWFLIQYQVAATAGTFSANEVQNALQISNQPGAGGYIGLKAPRGVVVKLRIGTSFTGLEGARKNLLAEMNTWDFEQVKKQAENTWNKALGQIEVQGKNEAAKTIFYSSLYRTMQHPRLMSDADGSYPRFAGSYEVERMKEGNYYDDFSMWDIYRAQLPLFEILQLGLINDFVRSMILKGEQGGWLPIFPCWNNYTAAMIGDHVTAFIASAWNKNIRGYDAEKAYALMRRNAFNPAPAEDYKNGKGRRALDSYLQYGYVPLEDGVPDAFHKNEQVSRTLEYAYDDYALSIVAAGLGKKADQQALAKRAQNYRNIFDRRQGLMNGRSATGSFYTPFHPDKKLSFITEGTPRQYTFYVPHDIKGLQALMGGEKAFENALDSLFLKNEYWHGNEPGHHIPFLYNYTASPYKTQRVVKRILEEEYSNGTGGLSGNDDAGQMSAWYVFAAMGLYPVDPVSGEYQLCTPLFERIRLKLPNGKTMEITVKGGGDHIRSIRINGRTHAGMSITHAMLTAGGKMEITTGND
ncbi:GH92 family glycosyl hydrolase [Chitinophaga sp.]|uniref:GH92 family glycosyl hydrolase n=1 Tax=Chitinophaga sp. TaxID=1869181 RepID=UPI0031D42D48